ncbi:ABC-type xenobiotic transporter [Sarracenia purpurea var. burkii]
MKRAMLSTRTVYSFVGENKTITEYLAVLEATVRLGLRQGLAKDLAVGNNGIVFAICAAVVELDLEPMFVGTNVDIEGFFGKASGEGDMELVRNGVVVGDADEALDDGAVG